MMRSLNTPLRLFVVQVLLSGLCQGFVTPSYVMNNQLSTSVNFETVTTSALMAKKKRRRRKQTTPAGESPEQPTPTVSDELPDFELAEDMEEKSAPKKVISNPDEITPAMMGTGKPARSVSELINDRSLEAKFEFDEPGEDALPDLAELTKKTVQADRPRGQLRQYGSTDTKEEESNPLENIPFITDSKGKVSGVKILEAGAWLGIGLLIVWEIYINSPLFDRAAPMAPVVYNLYM